MKMRIYRKKGGKPGEEDSTDDSCQRESYLL